MRALVRCVAASAAVGVFLAGCGAGGGGTDDPSRPAASAPASGSGSMGEAIVLEDGRHPVYLKTVDTSRREVTFDLLVFLTGDAAVAEWKKRHPGETEEAIEYFIVNDNAKLRSVPLADDVVVKVLPASGGPDTAEVDVAELTGPYVGRMFWLTVAGGKITMLEEQYLP
jgi:hypothetical protein